NHQSRKQPNHHQPQNLELAAQVKDYHSEAAALKDAISNLSKDGVTLEQHLLDLATQLPNDIHPSVPMARTNNSRSSLCLPAQRFLPTHCPSTLSKFLLAHQTLTGTISKS
ncbi:hypothetical protein PTTG_30872, partial [Puccinia triticina 1-1 BBBD Race 1]